MKIFLQSVFYVLAAFTFITTVLAMLPFKQWWVRACDFPRQQILWVGLITLALGLFRYSFDLQDVVIFAIVMVCVFYQTSQVLPYSPLWSKDLADAEPAEAKDLSLLVSNVREENHDHDRMVRLVEKSKADIVLLLEVNEEWLHSISDLKKFYPNYILQPQENTYGMALFSKFKLHQPRVHFLHDKQVPSISAKVELPQGKRCLLWCVHPKPPFPSEAETSKPRDLELFRLADRILGRRLPVIVAGDLNDVGWSATSSRFCKESGLKDPRIGRGQFNTFHTSSVLFRWPLDHIFLSPEFKVKSIRRLPDVGSDHFPIYLEASLQS